MDIPFIDLGLHHSPFKKEILKAIEEIMDSGSYLDGASVRAFESEFAAANAVKHCLAVANGTEALRIGLLACDIGPGDEVITATNTFIATLEAIALTGARPVLVDVDKSACMAPEKLEAAITSKTKIIMPVHLYGQCADMDPINEIAEAHGLTVFEDAAQAHFSEYKGRLAGTMSKLAAFSFYPTKNLGTIGQGGCILTDSDEIASSISMLRNHGQYPKYEHKIIAGNARMQEIPARVLSIELPYLKEWNARRIAIARDIRTHLKTLPGVVAVAERGDGLHNYHVLCAHFDKRDFVQEELSKRGIVAARHYPIPCHLQEGYAYLGYKKGDFPVSEWQAERLLSLPIYPEMTGKQVEFLKSSLSEILA